MTYKEKLKTCPVCGKHHGLTIKEKIISKSKIRCKECGATLRNNSIYIIFTLLVLYLTLKTCTFIKMTDSALYMFAAIFSAIFGSLSIAFLPLKPYHNYWQEFWDKDLK